MLDVLYLDKNYSLLISKILQSDYKKEGDANVASGGWRDHPLGIGMS